ncbi:PHP domain-containing protein [Rhodopirellula sp. MGV]|uniref:PHP domain-containing protein n=1 Tax=Rhodopirellula sp. MGV TaxID=2023130 RepID=UPI000B973AEB|nr:hypothetical protein [Rhodopirellula sp. MGV]OYP35521.1 hypothetical protein CGZ80_11825 [Rhodopirellula sp. MGV]PNY34484.1 hypothetical protein C2E31_23170 [Rhodopirellula baltica]
MKILFRFAFVALLICQTHLAVAQTQLTDDQPRHWKGNLHTHSLWSDGDQFPEMIADWYRERGYNFLALTDHNVISEGQRWKSLKSIIDRSDDGVLDRYRDRFGDHWVEQRKSPKNDELEIRLKPLSEFRALLERPSEFLMIQAEEISDRSEGKPVHINATNVAEALQPVGGDTVREAMQNNLRMILEHEKSHGRPVLPHVNHPNFGYAMTAEDLAAVVAEQFFEVYNGHPGVNQLGDDEHPSIELMWDQINAIRFAAGVEPILGIATDDSHEYHGRRGSRPGRGWVMVRSRFLTPEYLIHAMRRGDFHASSGVVLKQHEFDESTRTLTVEIDPAEGEDYQIDFITTMKPGTDPHKIGITVSSQKGNSASYQMKDGECYIRALITSSAAHTDPSFEGQKKQAWTQPVGWAK